MHKDPMEDRCEDRDPAWRKPRAHVRSQAWMEGLRESAWWPGLPQGPQTSDVAPFLPNHMDPPAAGETTGVGCAATRVAVVVTGLGDPDLGSRGWLLGWNVTTLGEKEPEMVREVESYQLDLVGLASTHSIGSG